jgi:GNAT superfamily N-acetyltransferase
MLRQSDIVVGFCLPQSGELIAFARVLTDYVYKALILDLIVDERYRAQGVGRQLLTDVVAHPLLSNVAHLELYCRPDVAPFYEAWGFTTDPEALCLMRRSKPPAP